MHVYSRRVRKVADRGDHRKSHQINQAHNHGGIPQPMPDPFPQNPPYASRFEQQPNSHSVYEAAEDYSSPPAKRQRTSLSYTGRERYEHEPRYGLGGVYPAQFNFAAQSHAPGPSSVPSTYSEYSYGHRRTNSSANSSPYVSPQGDAAGYQYGSTPIYTQPQRIEPYRFQPSYQTEVQYRETPQLTPPNAHSRQDSSASAQTKIAASQPTPTASSSLPPMSVHSLTGRSYDQEDRPMLTTDGPLIQLPPLQSTVSSKTRGTAPQLHSINVIPRIENLRPVAIDRHVDTPEHTPEAQSAQAVTSAS